MSLRQLGIIAQFEILETMARVGTINRGDLDLIHATDSVEDAINYIREKSD